MPAQSAPSTATVPAITAAAAAATSVPPSQGKADQKPSAEDEEQAKRKKRAERFGIPLVEPPRPKQVPAPKIPQLRGAKATTLDVRHPRAINSLTPSLTPRHPKDPDKLALRAARFSLKPDASAPAPKRPSPVVETIDKEELERRAKRAKRFGNVVS